MRRDPENFRKGLDKEKGRSYKLVLRSNGVRRFLLCSMCLVEAKRFSLMFPEGKGVFGGWVVLARKLSSLGVVPPLGLAEEPKVGRSPIRRCEFKSLRREFLLWMW